MDTKRSVPDKLGVINRLREFDRTFHTEHHHHLTDHEQSTVRAGEWIVMEMTPGATPDPSDCGRLKACPRNA